MVMIRISFRSLIAYLCKNNRTRSSSLRLLRSLRERRGLKALLNLLLKNVHFNLFHLINVEYLFN